MRRYVFRLSDRRRGSFQGVVVIFATEPQNVWRKLVTDSAAEQIRYSVMNNEIASLATELQGLVEGATIGAETPLLRQLFEDLLEPRQHVERLAQPDQRLGERQLLVERTFPPLFVDAVQVEEGGSACVRVEQFSGCHLRRGEPTLGKQFPRSGCDLHAQSGCEATTYRRAACGRPQGVQ